MYSVKSPANSGKKGRSNNTDSVGSAACYTGFLDFVLCLVFQIKHNVSEAGSIYVLRYKNMRSIYLVLHPKMETYPFSEMLCSVWTKSKNQVISSNTAKFGTVIYYNFKMFNPKCISAPVSHPHNIWNWVTFSLTCEEDSSTKRHLHIMGVFCNLWLFCKDNIRRNASTYLIL